MMMNAVQVRGLSIGFYSGKKLIEVISDLNFDLRKGETLCIVGESGSGKSVTAKAIMRIESPAKILSGTIELNIGDNRVISVESIDAKGSQMRNIRGDIIAMIFQEPMSALSPVHTIGEQIIETILLHQDMTESMARERAIELLRKVQIPAPEKAIDKYSFEFSGGMRQRAMIAMALSCNPAVLIADEPTTALDVTTQAEILKLLKELQKEFGMSVIFITHDIGVVAEIADRVAVMFRGKLIEIGETKKIFNYPQEEYTRHLITSSSKFTVLGEQPRGGKLPESENDTLLEVSNLNLSYKSTNGFFRKKVTEFHALKDISFSVKEGENLGIVGESGSGKTTLIRCISGLLASDSGKALYKSKSGKIIDLLEPDAMRKSGLYREIRMVFQDPFSSLNPRMTVEQIISEPLLVERELNRAQVRDRVAELLHLVGLPHNIMSRYPHAFSGGQRQRIVIARALAVEPRLIIADEATSALDGSVRSHILDLMFELQRKLGLSYIFVGHDLGVVRYFCDRIAVMKSGKIIEIGDAKDVCLHSKQEYTKELISAVPSTDPVNRKIITNHV